MTLVAGVDEAGRGCVIGPLVVAGILMDEKNISSLKSLGVKDSKQLTPKERLSLAPRIERLALKSAYREIQPDEIDRVVFAAKKLQKLNLLEAKAMAQVLNQLAPSIAYVDASDVLADRYGRQIQEMLLTETKVISEHRADVTYPVVSAASILAKVRRDSVIERLKKKYGDFGSGYPGDPRLRSFLIKCFEKGGSLPKPVRKSWRTIRDITSLKGQRKLI